MIHTDLKQNEHNVILLQTEHMVYFNLPNRNLTVADLVHN